MSEQNDTRKLELSDLDAIMQTDSGRRFLLRQLQMSGYFNSSYDNDARIHAYNEGKRQNGINLYRDMAEANPGQLINILREHNNG